MCLSHVKRYVIAVNGQSTDIYFKLNTDLIMKTNENNTINKFD